MVQMGKLGQKLKVDQRIVMHRTADPELDGYCGTILGKSFDDNVCAFYIILLDQPRTTRSGYKAITLIESCIDPIN